MFEWDPKKAAANLLKHGISFDEAATIFGDPVALDGLTPDTPQTKLGSSVLDARYSTAS